MLLRIGDWWLLGTGEGRGGNDELESAVMSSSYLSCVSIEWGLRFENERGVWWSLKFISFLMLGPISHVSKYKSRYVQWLWLGWGLCWNYWLDAFYIWMLVNLLPSMPNILAPLPLVYIFWEGCDIWIPIDCNCTYWWHFRFLLFLSNISW